MQKILIKNGQLVTPQKIFTSDLLSAGESIERIAENITDAKAEIVDASGKYIFPGFIDAHTHMGIPIRGTHSADDFDSGTLAALHGGVTTVMDFTVQEPGESLMHSLQRRIDWAKGKASVDYTFHCNITDLDKVRLKEIPSIIDKGLISFKAFTAYKEAGMQLDDEQILDVLWKVKLAGGTVMFHAENGHLIHFLTEKFILHNKTTAMHHALSRPPEAEIEAVWRITTLNQFIRCPIYFVHLTTAEAVQIAHAAKERGQSVYLETCPQYLIFDHTVYQREDGYRYIAAPPFRSERDQEYLWQGLQEGQIDVVGTDHCPFTLRQKEMGNRQFHVTPNGLAGVETLFPLLYSEGVAQGRLSLQRLISLIAEEPARLFGLFPQKGVLSEGSDADVVIFNPEGSSKISAQNLHSATDWSPYEGYETRGQIESVLLRGNWLVKDGAAQEKNLHRGKFVKALL